MKKWTPETRSNWLSYLCLIHYVQYRSMEQISLPLEYPARSEAEDMERSSNIGDAHEKTFLFVYVLRTTFLKDSLH